MMTNSGSRKLSMSSVIAGSRKLLMSSMIADLLDFVKGRQQSRYYNIQECALSRTCYKIKEFMNASTAQSLGGTYVSHGSIRGILMNRVMISNLRIYRARITKLRFLHGAFCKSTYGSLKGPEARAKV